MKQMMFLLSLALLLFVAACGPSAEEDTTAEADSLRQVEMEDLKMEAEEALAEADQAIDSLEVKAGQIEDRAVYDSTLAELQEMRDSLQVNLQELDTATEDLWDSIKNEVEEGVDDLREAVRDAEARFEEAEGDTTTTT